MTLELSALVNSFFDSSKLLTLRLQPVSGFSRRVWLTALRQNLNNGLASTRLALLSAVLD